MKEEQHTVKLKEYNMYLNLSDTSGIRASGGLMVAHISPQSSLSGGTLINDRATGLY